MKDRILFLLLSAVAVTPLFSQEISDRQIEMFHSYSQLLSPEKVYLHTDKDVYFATDTIWFSGYVENASYASEFDESNYIYVELINDQLYRNERSISKYSEYKKEVIERKKIRRIGNNFQGHIVVPEMNSTGRAIIRAYTYWMLNRPAEYLFYKEIVITNPMKDKLVSAMVEKKVRHKKNYLRLGEISPYEKHKEDDENDKKERYDVQFLPESGNYITGSNTAIYIKAIDSEGAGAEVYGEVLNSENKVVANYSTDSLGFGKIYISSLPMGKLYATVKDASGYEGDRAKLQDAVENGITINGTLNINGNDSYTESDRIIFNINTSAALLDNSLKLYLHNGSEIYYSKPIYNFAESISLNLKGLTPGIHSACVVDNAGNVYAERPFIVLPTLKEMLEINESGEKYGRREPVNVKIKMPAEMLDSIANFSVAVTDIGIVDNCETTTILSYMLLKSELKGYIENIDWYFNDSISIEYRMKRADLLLQTHGWRYYDTGKILQGKSETPCFGKEYKQTLFGKVMNPIGLTKRATVSFLAPSINFRAMGQVDSGYFVLKDVDFPENTRFIISAIGKNGRSQNHTPILQNDYFAPMYDYPTKTTKVGYSTSYGKIVESIYYNKDNGEHAMAFELNPAVVTSQLFTPKNSPSPIPNYPLKRDWYRDTSDMRTYSRSYTVGSYVIATYSGVREYHGASSVRIAVPSTEKLNIGALIGPKLTPGYMTRSGKFIEPGRWGLVLVYLNGSYINSTNGEAVSFVLSLPLSEVESIVYVSGLSASPFQTSFTMGEVSPYPVLMVKTKPSVRTGAQPYNVSSGNPLGWQKPIKFYSPKYDTPDSKKSKTADNRITLYWNPSLKLDENGEAVVSFYTSDSDTNYRIEIEGRSAAGQYHYAEKIIGREIKAINKSR